MDEDIKSILQEYGDNPLFQSLKSDLEHYFWDNDKKAFVKI